MRSTETVKKIQELKKQKNVCILAHYYQTADIQEIADFVGDSLDLARKAQQTSAEIILFAGVHFMAEGAKLLNPRSKVLIPDLRAGCSLSDSCPPDDFRAFREDHPDHFVVSYINCSAEIKAQSDVICTSSNATKIISRIPRDKKIIFSPDRNLGDWVSKQCGREMLLWPGSCIVHETFSERKIAELQVRYPDAELIAHPECEPSLLESADFIGSTSALLRYSSQSETQEFIVATEEGILHQMKKQEPTKTFIPAPPRQNCACNECPFMKLNTMDKILMALETESPEVTVREEITELAAAPLQRMLEWSA